MENDDRSLGEILVKLGYITQEQFFEALKDARDNDYSISNILLRKNIITKEQLNNAVKVQSERKYDFVSDDELMNVSDTVLSMLPDDFITLNKVLPVSYSNKCFIVGMINPGNEKIINEIIYLTGLNPQIKIITYAQFAKFLKKIKKENSDIQKYKPNIKSRKEKLIYIQFG